MIASKRSSPARQSRLTDGPSAGLAAARVPAPAAACAATAAALARSAASRVTKPAIPPASSVTSATSCAPAGPAVLAGRGGPAACTLTLQLQPYPPPARCRTRARLARLIHGCQRLRERGVSGHPYPAIPTLPAPASMQVQGAPGPPRPWPPAPPRAWRPRAPRRSSAASRRAPARPARRHGSRPSQHQLIGTTSIPKYGCPTCRTAHRHSSS